MELSYRWGWKERKKDFKDKEPMVRDVILNCHHHSQDEEFAKKYDVKKTWVKAIRLGNSWKAFRRELEKA